MSGIWNRWSRRFASWGLSSGLSTYSLLAFGAEEPRIRLVEDESQYPIAIEVVGLTEYDLPPLSRNGVDAADFAQQMSVIETTNRGDSLPLVSGTYQVQRGALRFTPSTPLQPGLTYRVVLHLNDLANQGDSSRGWLETEIIVPTIASSGTVASTVTVPA